MKKLKALLTLDGLRKLLPWRTEDRYRPEKYYMRGPGPKAKAKDCEAPSGNFAPYGARVSDRRAH